MGFSISESTVQQWIVSNHIISHILGGFQQSLDLLGENNKCKDVLACRMKLDEDNVKSAYDLLPGETHSNQANHKQIFLE